MSLLNCARRSFLYIKPRPLSAALISWTTQKNTGHAPSLALPRKRYLSKLLSASYTSNPITTNTITLEDEQDDDLENRAEGAEPSDNDLLNTTPASAAAGKSKPEFVPRQTFTCSKNLVNSYFLGHHAKALTKMKHLVGSVEMVLECRDYRVPLSSRNPLFEDTLQGKERVIIYTKRDLGMRELTKKTRNIIMEWHKPHKVLFSDTGNKNDIKKIVKYMQEAAKELEKLTGMRILIVGMPNVGKSSLLNELRRIGTGSTNKVARTGGEPGVTRNMSTTIKVSKEPLIYVMDSPGVFLPYMSNPITMLKLALVGSIKESLIPPIIIADYLLFHLNKNGMASKYKRWSNPTNDVLELLQGVAKQTGRLAKGGLPQLDQSAIWLLRRYRNGILGRFILDPVEKDSYDEWIHGDGVVEESQSAARRRIKKEMVEAKKKKHTKGGSLTAEE